MSENNRMTFELPRIDAGYLLEQEMGLHIGRGSAFYGTPTREPESEFDREEYRMMLENPEFCRLARIAAEPDLYVINRIGGGSMALEEIRLHHKSSEGETVAAVAFSSEGSTIMGFENFRAYLDWWSERFTGKSDKDGIYFFPLKISLEEFLYILHTIDSFRRVSYLNQLNFVRTETPTMEFEEFARTMADSVKSRDIRWLLPAFLVLTPGLGQYKMEIAPEQVSILAEQDYTLTLAAGTDGKKLLAFGETGKNLGVEFFRSWLMASGFEINAAGEGGSAAADRIFIAPTALTNHYWHMESAEGGRALVNHRSCTAEELKTALAGLFEKAGKQGFCCQCGAKLPAGAAFCGSCGAKV